MLNEGRAGLYVMAEQVQRDWVGLWLSDRVRVFRHVWLRDLVDLALQPIPYIPINIHYYDYTIGFSKGV